MSSSSASPSASFNTSLAGFSKREKYITVDPAQQPSEAVIKEPFFSLFDERYVGELRTQTERGDCSKLLVWMQRFEEGRMELHIQALPKVVGAFYQLMIDELPKGLKDASAQVKKIGRLFLM